MSTAPPRNFQIAFRMFDLDGDGNVDLGEFNKVKISRPKNIYNNDRNELIAF